MKIILLTAAFFLSFLLQGQTQSDYQLTAFHGTVYEMPKYSEEKGFSEGLEKFDSTGHIVLPVLNFRPDYPDVHFPAYELKDRFAFALKANLKVQTAGCYRITLVSDDGSMLWIDEELSVDNGGMHKWKIKRDTLALTTGNHDLRLWYYNAVGPCGLALKIDVTDSSYCASVKTDLMTCISFEENLHTLDSDARQKIDLLLEGWEPAGKYQVSITGYADAKGASDYNDALSARRAKSVGEYLSESVNLAEADFQIVGKGEVENLKGEVGGCSTDRAVILTIIRK